MQALDQPAVPGPEKILRNDDGLEDGLLVNSGKWNDWKLARKKFPSKFSKSISRIELRLHSMGE